MTRATLTIDEAAAWLHPRIPAATLRALVTRLAIKPVPDPAPPRTRARSGRPAARYDAETLIRLHAALLPWLAVDD